ncbi:uncharacterized protein LOC129854878 [Salvelinus fontinalis]|uniref:uncharacterized protein LOC129854878 n=1 Tax=Salvelinus fontinalis TaxID=8038 RepID=UPI002484FAD1|nr:uncharacterized protein LOC129854878 [Salvelinus fontinalis]
MEGDDRSTAFAYSPGGGMNMECVGMVLRTEVSQPQPFLPSGPLLFSCGAGHSMALCAMTKEEPWISVRVTVGFLVTSLAKVLLPRLLSLALRPALGRVFVVPNIFHLRMMEATVFLGTFNAAEMFWYPSPDLSLDTILYRSSTDKSFDLMACFLL